MDLPGAEVAINRRTGDPPPVRSANPPPGVVAIAPSRTDLHVMTADATTDPSRTDPHVTIADVMIDPSRTDLHETTADVTTGLPSTGIGGMIADATTAPSRTDPHVMIAGATTGPSRTDLRVKSKAISALVGSEKRKSQSARSLKRLVAIPW